MLEEIIQRIDERLKAVGISATRVSKAAGMSEDAIRNLKRAVKTGEERGVSTKTITALAPVLQTTAAWLLSGGDEPDVSADDSDLNYIPLAGKVGAGAEVETLEEADPKRVQVPVSWGDATAFLVTGDSCFPIYEEGDVILVRGEQRLVADELEGRMCVVETADDEGLVKRIYDDGRGTFTLESPNAQKRQYVRLRFGRPVFENPGARKLRFWRPNMGR